MAPVLKIDLLRSRQEERLLPVLEAWNMAKKTLEDAIAKAEAKEREYREIAEDVRQKVAALDLVARLAVEFEGDAEGTRTLNGTTSAAMLPAPAASGKTGEEEKTATLVQVRNVAADPQRTERLVVTSSRSLFSSADRSRFARLSILQ